MPIFVNINLASGVNDGSSWENAYRGPTALQEALGINTSNNNEIWVAQGTYTPSQRWNVANGNISADPRTESFRIPNDCKVYGGFSGTETSLAERDIAANPTILSGNLDVNPANNAYHVVFFYQVSENTVLDGFKVTNGNANGVAPNNLGGGIYNNPNAFFPQSSNPTINNSVFSENSASADGGAVLNNGSLSGVASPNFNYCVFADNSANDGGAVYNSSSLSGTSSPNFINCVFSNNLANSNGGAVYNNGSISGTSSPNFDNCVFSENSASAGGGAVYNNGTLSGTSSPNFDNCVFFENSADSSGGVVYNYVDPPNGISSPSFMNVTFFNNNANISGTVIYNSSSLAIPTITNSILWNDFENPTIPSLIESEFSTTTITYSDVIGGWSGTSNIDDDPLFINPENPIGPDNIWMTNDDGLALQPCSLCLGAGTPVDAPPTDIIGATRPSPPSIGAYEVAVFSISMNSSSLTVDCFNNGVLTLSGVNNESLLWQYSEDNGLTWTNTNNTSSTYTFENLTTDTLFRVRVTTTDCPNVIFYSETASVEVNQNCPTFQITTTSLPNGVVTIPYSALLTEVGGITPVRWSIIEEPQTSNNTQQLSDDSLLAVQINYTSLPPGLQLNALTGEISGTPTLPGSFTFTVQVIDSENNVAIRTFTIIIILLPNNNKVARTNTEIIESTKLHDWVISSKDTSITVDFEN